MERFGERRVYYIVRYLIDIPRDCGFSDGWIEDRCEVHFSNEMKMREEVRKRINTNPNFQIHINGKPIVVEPKYIKVNVLYMHYWEGDDCSKDKCDKSERYELKVN